MKVLFQTLYDDTFSSRFRVYQYLPYFRERGLDFDVAPAVFGSELQRCLTFPRLLHRWRLHHAEVRRRKRSIRSSPRYDVVVVQKGFTTINWRWWIGMQQSEGVPFVLDIDDAVHLQPSLVPPRMLRPFWDSKQIEKTAREAAAVVVGNRFLGDDLRGFSDWVVEIPTAVDLRRYTWEGKPGKKKGVVIGWSGSGSAHGLLNTVLPIVRRLHERHPDLSMHIISNTRAGIDFALLGKTPVEMIQWSPENEVPALKQMDIGLMPLLDTRWMKYKCAFKALQYMAVGVAPVCSPVGLNSDIIDHGRNGFLACTEEEWFAAMEQLIMSPELRFQMGQAGRAMVEKGYSVEQHAGRWLALLEEISGGMARPS